MKRSLLLPLSVAMAALLFALAVLATHRLLQNDRVYRHLSGIVKTYDRQENEDGSWDCSRVEKPFVSPNEGNMLSWDAENYDRIRQTLYDPGHGWQGYFAFYPMFPLVWRWLQLSPMGMAMVNWLLYAVGLALLALLFGSTLPRWSWWLLLCAPMAVVFMIPYSEALFFLGIAAGMVGLARNRYWLYFVGFFLASTTRAAGNIMLVAWVIVDLLAVLAAKSSAKEFLRRLSLHVAPIIGGILAVVLFQHLRGAEHWFEYMLAQKEWGKELSWPTWPLTDWSEESASVTQPLLFLLFIPSLVWLALKAWHAVADKAPHVMDNREMLRLFSILFFVGNLLLALFSQHGCLFSQARLLTCTPFFAFLVLDLSTGEKSRAWRWGMLAAFAVAVLLCLGMLSKWSQLGSWIVFVLAALVFYGNSMRPWLRNALLGLTIVLDIYWTAYLFNCYLTNCWIFT